MKKIIALYVTVIALLFFIFTFISDDYVKIGESILIILIIMTGAIFLAISNINNTPYT